MRYAAAAPLGGCSGSQDPAAQEKIIWCRSVALKLPGTCSLVLVHLLQVSREHPSPGISGGNTLQLHYLLDMLAGLCPHEAR